MKKARASTALLDQQITLIIPQGRLTATACSQRGWNLSLSKENEGKGFNSFGPCRGRGTNTLNPKGRATP
jgi:hypothetical protein